ncbi:MAG TPA: HD domain-containing phosphohydrolase [Gaiellaceae bacterium]|jgi:response regulator RpfG family c-di-GMP phosphodiesterase|nr:HD domain-containing phosphohydrolase [Gaiellaceae bacterium]
MHKEQGIDGRRKRLRLLVVDDDRAFRALLRTTFEIVDIEVEEAASAERAAVLVPRFRPDVVVLDVKMPGMGGLEYCRRLKADPSTRDVRVVLLTGSGTTTQEDGTAAGADAYLVKPFSPLELLAVVERLAGGLYGVPFRAEGKRDPGEQLLLYARDLRHLLEVERGQRLLIQQAYEDTVAALASALETKDTGTRAHSQRVQRYAIALAEGIEPSLAGSQSASYGFLLHDVGKIGIPDDILQKPGPLTEAERRLMQSHTILGEQMLGGVAFLDGDGLCVVRSHHERWDGDGYPDGTRGERIPMGARIFAVADALDAMTSDRPYRRAQSWETARQEILGQSGRQFDPGVVNAFVRWESELRSVREEFSAADRAVVFG